LHYEYSLFFKRLNFNNMSQNVRNVVVASPASNQAKKISTNASTFGELKQNSVFAGLYTTGLEVIVNPGRHTLTRDEAALPEGDFQVFLVPTKNKAGAMSHSQASSLAQEIAAAIVSGAEKASQDDVNALREVLISDIEEFFDVSLDDDCSECQQALDEAKELMP
jgi:hypothetical protein